MSQLVSLLCIKPPNSFLFYRVKENVLKILIMAWHFSSPHHSFLIWSHTTVILDFLVSFKHVGHVSTLRLLQELLLLSGTFLLKIPTEQISSGILVSTNRLLCHQGQPYLPSTEVLFTLSMLHFYLFLFHSSPYATLFNCHIYCFKSALLSCNLHTIKCNHFKYTC